jgi:hypothetical protein
MTFRQQQFGLDDKKHHGEPFQSLLAVKRSSGKTIAEVCSKLASKMRSQLEECDIIEEEEDDMHHRIEDFLYQKFREMIACERAAWKVNYFTFYRVVDKKYVLYQFNTLMLSIFHDQTWGTESHRNGLICTPSLDDSMYVNSINDLFVMFKDKQITGDTGIFASNMLISVNNCLTPVESRIQMHSGLTHECEASPMHYFEGYNETHTYEQEMVRFMRLFFELPSEEAIELVKDIFKMYSKAQKGAGKRFKGHCLQICIPSTVLSHFAYPCVSWGKPVNLFLGEKDKLHAFEISETSPFEKKEEGLERVVSLAELLRRRELCELQTRIIAHPNLFLTAGAVTNVFHGNPWFDDEAFKVALFNRLKPYINISLIQDKRIQLRKFRYSN